MILLTLKIYEELVFNNLRSEENKIEENVNEFERTF